jgi:tetratricopeptide (TPR) repeat protein
VLDMARSNDATEKDPQAVRASAIASAARAAALDPRDASAEEQRGTALLIWALEARLLGENAGATTALETAETAATEALRRSKVDPAYRGQGRAIGRIHSLRGNIRHHRDDHAGAKADFDEALRRKPNDPEARALALFGARFVDQGAVVEGAEALFRATGEPSRLFDAGFAWQTLGSDRADIGDVEGAIQCYGRAIDTYLRALRLDPDGEALLTYCGETRVLRARLTRGAARTADLETARGEFDRALRGYRGDMEVFLRRAAWHETQGDTANALADFERAVGDERGRNPRFYEELARGLLARAKALADEGRKAEARPLLLRVVPTLEIALERRQDVLPRVLPPMVTAEARLATLAEDAADREAHLVAARARLAGLEPIARGRTGREAARLEAYVAFLRAEIALAAGESALAAKEATAAIRLRETEHAARRWSLDARWYERLAEVLAAAGRPEEAQAARARAVELPR